MDAKIEIFKNLKEKLFLHIDKFFFAEADSNYVDIYLTVGNPFKAVRMLLGELENKINTVGDFNDHHILRVGRKYLINVEYLTRIDIVKHTIELLHPTQGTTTTLILKKTEVKRLYEQLDIKQRLKVLQTVYHKQRLTVPVAELNVVDEEWVDLGLPSGTLWASKNVDAFNAETFGNLYDWYKAKEMSIPTKEQFQELLDECVWTHCESKEGNGGFLVMGTNDNIIFIPCSGWRKPGEFTRDINVKGGYWTSNEVNEDSAYSSWFSEIDNTLTPVEGLDNKEWELAVRLVK